MFGYSPEDALVLEGLAEELVRDGSAKDLHTARRALAAVTWRPLADEVIARRLADR